MKVPIPLPGDEVKYELEGLALLIVTEIKL